MLPLQDEAYVFEVYQERQWHQFSKIQEDQLFAKPVPVPLELSESDNPDSDSAQESRRYEQSTMLIKSLPS